MLTDSIVALIVAVPMAVLTVRWVRRFVDTPGRLPRWDKLLRWVWLVALVVFIDRLFPVKSNLRSDWYLLLVLLALILTLTQVWTYRPARTLLAAFVPLIGCFAVDITVNSWPGNLVSEEYSLGKQLWYSVSWLIAFVLIARSQKKALEKQRAEEAHNRQIEAQNAELERLVAERTAELVRQKEELVQALDHLKTTQDRLVQKEKMASLGELTAGIAHEIQNPLNFVNNFSEVSTELLDELREGPFQHLPDADRTYADEILADLTLNIQKITHHGKRADSIVKGMLQHSRVNSGERQPTDLNALADEYLRLSYHGMRRSGDPAKDKSFNSALVTDLDPTVGLLTIAGQDVGRVLLNLFNNAFYAVQEKKKRLGDAYSPEVAVCTRRCPDGPTGGLVEIRVRDNGDGIPDAVLDKIYQPFFTTKPTGEGTGLGLSLSYDIITKGHGGALTVTTQPGEFTEFIITLPLQVEIAVS